MLALAVSLHDDGVCGWAWDWCYDLSSFLSLYLGLAFVVLLIAPLYLLFYSVVVRLQREGLWMIMKLKTCPG
jgi:hypothetical protein